MLIAAAELRRIREGRIDVAFRRWRRPSVKTGTRLRTAAGVIEVTDITRIDEAQITDEDARRAGASDRATLLNRIARYREGDLYRITLRHAGADPRLVLRDEIPADMSPVLARLRRLDAGRGSGPWTRGVLVLIGEHEGVRAAELAARLGRDTPSFKADVRKLKELGLTESLTVGYRLSLRGRAVLAALMPSRS